MIVFITAQDDATNDNFLVANYLTSLASAALCGPDAVRSPLLDALHGNNSTPLIAFSHGRASALVGHDNEIGLGVADVALLSSRYTYAHACHTGERFGQAVSVAGGIWFGFSGPVNALPADPDSIEIFRGIIDFIIEKFPSCNSVALANSFLNELADLTDRGFDYLSGTASMEQLHALRDISRRLRIWLPDVGTPIKHLEAYGDPLL